MVTIVYYFTSYFMYLKTFDFIILINAHLYIPDSYHWLLTVSIML